MKRILMLFLMVISCMMGCTKSPCDDIVCVNGRYCDDGECICPDGWGGYDCTTPETNNITVNTDVCDGIVCYNGGSCVNGVCDCPEGWTGPSCDDRETPTVVIIKKIKITAFAPYDNGNNWDVFDGPDLTVRIGKDQSFIYTHGTFYEDANPALDYTFNINFRLESPTEDYGIYLYDNDEFEDDYMGGYNFTPYLTSLGTPATLQLSNPDFPTVMVLTLEYEF